MSTKCFEKGENVDQDCKKCIKKGRLCKRCREDNDDVKKEKVKKNNDDVKKDNDDVKKDNDDVKKDNDDVKKEKTEECKKCLKKGRKCKKCRGSISLDPTVSNLAFPGVEGFGSYSQGGSGGEIYTVHSLDGESKKGTLRYAIECGKRPLIVKFAVCGNIDLGGKDLKLRTGRITIDGSEGPGKGICITGGAFIIEANNVIIRYIRSRPMRGTGDAINIRSGNDIVIDHCSCSWSSDEVLTINPKEKESANIDLNNITISNCAIYEAFGDGMDGHRFGSILAGGDLSRISFIKNLYASCDSRNPRMANRVEKGFKEPPFIDFRNNVIYNWGRMPGYNGEEVDNPVRMNVINNAYITGPSTSKKTASKIFYEKGSTESRGFFFGNLLNGERPKDEYDLVNFKDGWSDRKIKEYQKTKEFVVDNTETVSSRKVVEYVLENVGCRLPMRDAEDLRIIKNVKEKTGCIVDNAGDYYLPDLN